jgi:hypothetical protein
MRGPGVSITTVSHAPLRAILKLRAGSHELERGVCPYRRFARSCPAKRSRRLDLQRLDLQGSVTKASGAGAPESDRQYAGGTRIRRRLG